MLDIGYSELLLIAVVALVVIGPKDLPRVMMQVGRWVGKARGMARHMRSGIDTMMREAELEEMERQWKAHNAAIMAGTATAGVAAGSGAAAAAGGFHDPERDDDLHHASLPPYAPPRIDVPDPLAVAPLPHDGAVAPTDGAGSHASGSAGDMTSNGSGGPAVRPSAG